MPEQSPLPGQGVHASLQRGGGGTGWGGWPPHWPCAFPPPPGVCGGGPGWGVCVCVPLQVGLPHGSALLEAINAAGAAGATRCQCPLCPLGGAGGLVCLVPGGVGAAPACTWSSVLGPSCAPDGASCPPPRCGAAADGGGPGPVPPQVWPHTSPCTPQPGPMGPGAPQQSPPLPRARCPPILSLTFDPMTRTLSPDNSPRAPHPSSSP